MAQIKGIENCKAYKVDINDPKVIELIATAVKAQKDILALKKVDWAKMRNTYITI